jgi:hypothetical protein
MRGKSPIEILNGEFMNKRTIIIVAIALVILAIVIGLL